MILLAVALETSLVEWKLMRADLDNEVLDSLETSLVEWKPVTAEDIQNGYVSLGNFLSGMETEHLEYRGPAELLLPWKLP